jgi:hypothetical protein
MMTVQQALSRLACSDDYYESAGIALRVALKEKDVEIARLRKLVHNAFKEGWHSATENAKDDDAYSSDWRGSMTSFILERDARKILEEEDEHTRI